MLSGTDKTQIVTYVNSPALKSNASEISAEIAYQKPHACKQLGTLAYDTMVNDVSAALQAIWSSQEISVRQLSCHQTNPISVEEKWQRTLIHSEGQ